jgi:1-acyl-sn-glycerol-3-phosphate acyltransferase
MKSTYHVPKRIRFSRTVLRPVFRALFHLLAEVRIYGIEYIPEDSAYLIAVNHISLFEPPFVLSFWPVAPEAVGAADVWDRLGQSALARLYGGIPVYRGQYDRRVIETMLAALHEGYPLLIAPEGGRSHTPGLRRALPGVAYLMDKAGVPVVPVGVVGSTEDFLKRALRAERPILEMHIGHPIKLNSIKEKGGSRKTLRQLNADKVMAHIAALLPLEYRGFYANHVG